MSFVKSQMNLWPLIIVVYLSITGLLCVLSAQFYMGVKPNPIIGAICVGIIFGIYILNRYTDSLEDFTNDIHRYMFFSKRKFLFLLGIIAIAFSILTLLILEKLNYYHLLLIGLGITYSFKLIPWVSKNKLVFYRLKEIPFIKNVVVAVAWGLSIFMIPISFADHLVKETSYINLLCISCIILVLNNTVFGDIRDLNGDLIAKTKTLPVLWGARKCFFLLFAIDFCWLLTILIVNHFSPVDPMHFIFLVSVALFPLVYILPYIFKIMSTTQISFLSESDLLFFAVGLFALKVL